MCSGSGFVGPIVGYYKTGFPQIVCEMRLLFSGTINIGHLKNNGRGT
jgi:hypothetical protein